MNLATHTPRRTTRRWTLGAALGLAALMLPALTTPARAQVSATPAPPVYVPNTSNSGNQVTNPGSVGPVPFSWLQFKQQFGGTGVPAVPQYPSYNPQNTNAYSATLGNAYPAPNAGLNLAGEYVRAYLLGDYGGIEPPGGFSNFFDEILSGTSGVIGWTAPDVNYGASAVSPIIVDDHNTLNISSVTGGTPVATTTFFSGFADADAGWVQLLASTANAIPSNIDDYNGDSYDKISAISRPKNESVDGNGVINGYSGNVSFFHWYPDVTVPGPYTAYAWFPSQNATLPTATSPILPTERHVVDAQYQILINGQVVQTATVDQQSGGTWVQIGGPFNFPAQSGTFGSDGATPPSTTYTFTAPAAIEIRLNNTTNDPAAIARGTNGNPDATTYIVADAVELRGEDGSTTRMVSSPVAVNKTDYPELFSGYSIADYSDYSGVGGLHPEYQQAHLALNATNGTTGTVTAGTAAAPITDVFNGAYVTGAGVETSVNTPQGGGSVLPLDQLVYFTRDETVVSATDPNAVQTVGAVYCVDGRNGNVVWRYPSANPVVVNDTDTAIVAPATTPHFTETGGTVESSPTAYPPPTGGQYWQTAAVAPGAPTAGTFAQWNFPPPTTGVGVQNLYQVYVWNPAPAVGETRVPNAVYTININGVTTATCVSDQTTGGQWVALMDTNGNSTFNLTPGTSFVTLANSIYNGSVPGGAVITANAVEFVPAGSLGTIDSTPAVVRNMRVLTRPGAVGGDKWETRTAVVVADNLGKVYALDAAGNQDGNDTLYDANGVPVSFDATGATMNPPAGGYVLPYTPKQYGSTRAYWIWQPNPGAQVATQVIDDNTNPAQPAALPGQSAFTVGQGFTTTVTTPAIGPPPVVDAYPPPNGTALSDPVVLASSIAAPATPDFVTWSPLLPAGTSLCNVYAWYPGDVTATTSAHYTVVNGAGVATVVTPAVNQAILGGQWVFLGQFVFGQTANPPGPITPPNAAGQFALTPNTIVLDNTTTNPLDVGKTVYADAIRVDVIKPSQLLTPLAFQMCSPTVSLTPTNYTTYGMATPSAGVPPTNDATIYIGNSNGVMYSLEGGGVYGTPPVTDIRRNVSLDPNTPTAGVNWWFDFGGNPNDIVGGNSLGTTYAPAYDPYDGPAEDPTQDALPLASRTPDGLLLFSTFSPQAADDGGAVNQGYLFAVDAKYGPFGDGGDTGGAYTAADPTSRVATQKFNTNPVPYWTFPDKFGTLKTDPTIDTPTTSNPLPLNLGFTYGTVPESDHLVTSEIPAVGTAPYAFQPAANPVGDSAAVPLLYTASVPTSPAPFDTANNSRHVYFAANDPNTEDPTAGRIYGVNAATGELDAPSTTSYPFIYPATLGVKPTQVVDGVPLSPNNPYGDPNKITFGDPDALIGAYVGGDQYNDNTADVPNSFGAFTDQDASTGYFVSSSPVAAPISFPTSTASLPGSVTNSPTGAAGSTGAGLTTPNQTVQMLYMADLTGLMHYVDLTGNPGNPAYSSPAVDLYKDVFDFQVGDTIISTPALVPDASGAGYTVPEPAATGTPPMDAATNTRVGGALFVTTEGGDIVELEAFPTVDTALTGTAVRLKDWTYAGPGGYSSPAVASFNTTNVVPGSTVELGDSEWIYVGGDQGTCYGFTPNNTSANGTANGGTAPPSGAPGSFVPPTNLAPPTTVPPNRNFYSQVTATAPPASGSLTFNPLQGPPLNPVFDWGQTAYIEIFGVDQANPANATNITPKAIRLTFTIKPVGRVGRGLRIINKVIDLQSGKNVYPIATGTGWPPANTTLSTSSAAASATGTIVGPNAAVYAYQLGDGTTDPQTPGSKVQIANITEQVQYYDTSTPPKLVTVTINGTADQGSIIRTKAGGTQPTTGIAATAAVDQATLSILNPLAVRGAGRSLGSTPTPTYYNMTLTPQSKPTLGQLGPFTGVNSNAATAPASIMAAVTANTAIFTMANAAMTNGNSLLTYAPLGGLLYNYTDGTHMNAQIDTAASSTLTQVQAPPQYQAVVVASTGLISHGTEAVGATPQQGNPNASSPTAPNNATPPTATTDGDYGSAVLNILDRSALGAINMPITRLRMNNPTIGWNDNSETGNGSGAVINPLPWEQMPQAYYVSGRTSSPDYPDIGSTNTSVELLPRTGTSYSGTVDQPGVSPTAAPGSDTYITASDATLAPSGADTGATRALYPNPALIHLSIPRYQPANLESYAANAPNGTTSGGVLVPGVNHVDTMNQRSTNVAEGYVARGQVFIDTRQNGRRDRTEAYRSVQVWTGVPADTSTSVAETTIDIGSVPAGFGLYGMTGASGIEAPTNNNWSPLIPGATVPTASPYAHFFKPITISNEGNVNLMNVHLDQRIYPVTGSTPPLTPDTASPDFLTFQSDTVNNPYGLNYPQSVIPSGDFGTMGATVTGTQNLPLVRSNFDFFNPTATWNGSSWTDPTYFDTFVPNPLLVSGTALNVPGATLHKPRPGDPSGAIMTVPDTPHNNYPNVNGSVNLANQPYRGRPVVSMAIPLATPVGTYSATIRAFEGYDPGAQTFLGPLYAGSPITALTPWQAVAGQPYNVLYFNTNPANPGPLQTASDPGTTLRATVVETRLTDGVPLPVNSTTFNGLGVPVTTTTSAVLPMIDSAPPTTGGATPAAVYNSNDIQPWAFYDQSAGKATVIWASARAATTTALQQTDPYDLVGSSLASLTLPTNMSATNGSWWSAPVPLTFPLTLATPAPTPIAPDSLTATNPSVAELGANPAIALWVSAATTNNQKTYSLVASAVSYNGASQPQFQTNPTVLLKRQQPIFGPRGTYVYAGPSASLALSPLAVPSANLSPTSDPAPTSDNAPLIFWSTRAGGRSQILYWPAVKADPNATGKIIVTSGVLPIPADLRSVANPTAVARIVAVNGTPLSVVDVTYTGVSAATGQSDVYTSRYVLTINNDSPPSTTDAGAVTSLMLTPTPTLLTTALSPAPTLTYLPTEPTLTETMVNDGLSGFQARDTGWVRDPKAFELDVLDQVSSQSGSNNPIVNQSPAAYAPLLPSGFFAYLQANPGQTTYPNSRLPIYDKSSGQWSFTVNWKDLDAYYTNTASLGNSDTPLLTFVNWLYAATGKTYTGGTGGNIGMAPNLVVYTNPAAGTVRLSAPLPKTTAMVTTTTTSGGVVTTLTTNFAGFQALVNPQALRVTFQNNANVASISFIDDAVKTNAAPYGATGGGTVGKTVTTSREWYLYRKAGVGNGNAAATSSVLFYKTRRLTAVLGAPIQLTQSGTAPLGYVVTNLKVTLGGADVTADVDVDWSRGRLYFPDAPTATNALGYEGQTVGVSYIDASGASHISGTNFPYFTVTWQDELQANDPNAATDQGEHVVPITNAVNESDPCAFLNPTAGVSDLNDSANPNHVSTAHSVWLFWSSSRNAGATNGTGADLYWETIDPRFEVVPGP